jgi:hypothetical protein
LQNSQCIDTTDLLKAEADFKTFLADKDKLNSIFGFARDGGDGESGQSSALMFDDVLLEINKTQAVDHIKIDRFTGGVIQGALYSEELIQSEELSCNIMVHPGRRDAICKDVRAAFLSALYDLTKGRLALGAKSYGFCNGTAEFSGDDKDSWQVAWHALTASPQPSSMEAMT